MSTVYLKLYLALAYPINHIMTIAYLKLYPGYSAYPITNVGAIVYPKMAYILALASLKLNLH